MKDLREHDVRQESTPQAALHWLEEQRMVTPPPTGIGNSSLPRDRIFQSTTE